MTVDREQVRRDAERELAGENVHQSATRAAEVFARHCLALLAELEQAQQIISDLTPSPDGGYGPNNGAAWKDAYLDRMREKAQVERQAGLNADLATEQTERADAAEQREAALAEAAREYAAYSCVMGARKAHANLIVALAAHEQAQTSTAALDIPDFFVVETGEYEQRFVFGVYRTERGGVRAIKRNYESPYRVSWTEERDDGNLVLVGQFQAVHGYSTHHIARYDFAPGNFGDAR